jgi:hypothetical protein
MTAQAANLKMQRVPANTATHSLKAPPNFELPGILKFGLPSRADP